MSYSSGQDLIKIRERLQKRALDDYNRHGILYLPALSRLPSPAVYWASEIGGDVLTTREARTALVSYVGRIIPDTSRVNPDANWNGTPIIAGDSFEHSCLAFHVGVALKYHDAFLQPSLQSQKNLDDLKSLMLTDGRPVKHCRLSRPLAIRHSIFQRKPLFALDMQSPPPAVYRRYGDPQPAAGPVPSWFSIRGWPLRTERARADIIPLFDTHTICPLPAYDEDGMILSPMEYEAALPGALVNVMFTLRHAVDRNDRSHYFTTDLEELSIICRGCNPRTSLRQTTRLPLTARYPLPSVDVSSPSYGEPGSEHESETESDVTFDTEDSDNDRFPLAVLPVTH
ncbi:hypothetical protein FB107DRAFT_268406 [Schizophyllum commune]